MWTSIKIWIKAKFGRITTALGGLMTLADLDISPIRDSLESWMSHKWVQALTAILFIVSFLRHHQAAQQTPKA